MPGKPMAVKATLLAEHAACSRCRSGSIPPLQQEIQVDDDFVDVFQTGAAAAVRQISDLGADVLHPFADGGRGHARQAAPGNRQEAAGARPCRPADRAV